MTQASVIPIAAAAKKDRNLRIRERLFPDAESWVFKNKSGGFVSLPILFRRVVKLLKPKQLQLIVYLWLRTDKYSICYPTLDDIAHELGQQNISRLKKTLRELESLALLRIRAEKGRMYFLVCDPRHCLLKLRNENKIEDWELDDANDLLEQLKQPPIMR